MTPQTVYRETRQRGITRVETLVVAACAVALLAVALPLASCTRTQDTGGSARVLYVIASAVDSYKNDFGDYPPSEPDRIDRRNDGVSPDAQRVWGAAALVYYLNGNDHEGYVPGGRHYPPRVEGVKSRLMSVNPQRVVFLDEWDNPVRYFGALRHRGNTVADIYPRACDVRLDGSGSYQYTIDDGNGPAETVTGHGLRVPVARWLDTAYKGYESNWQHHSEPINAASYLLVSAGPDKKWGTGDDTYNSR